MCEELFFYGIDAGFISKEESLTRTYFIPVGQQSVLVNLPESNESTEIDIKYKRDDWKLFRAARRNITKNIMNIFLLYDDVKSLQEEISKQDQDLELLLNEAAILGSVKCFKYLLLNEANVSITLMKKACKSGNEEIIQLLVEKGIKLNTKCLDNAITNWNNKVARWMIEEQGIQTSLFSSCVSSNFSMALYLIDKGVDFNEFNKILFTQFNMDINEVSLKIEKVLKFVD